MQNMLWKFNCSMGFVTLCNIIFFPSDAADYTMQQLAIIRTLWIPLYFCYVYILYFILQKFATIQLTEKRENRQKKVTRMATTLFGVDGQYAPESLYFNVMSKTHCDSSYALTAHTHTMDIGPDDKMNNKTWPQRVQVTFYSAFIVRFPCAFSILGDFMHCLRFVLCAHVSLWVYAGRCKGRINFMIVVVFFLAAFCMRIWIYLLKICAGVCPAANKSIRYRWS